MPPTLAPTSTPGIPADPSRAALRWWRWPTPPNSTRVDIAYGDSAVISGTVTDASGAPVPQVMVLARDTLGRRLQSNWTDGTGRFTVAVEPNETWVVSFRPLGGPELAYAGVDGANVTVGAIGTQVTGIDAVLPTGSLTVTVADGDEPGSGLWTRLDTYTETGQQLYVDATTDSNGNATYSYLPAGDYQLQVNPVGDNRGVKYGPFTSDGLTNLAVNVTLPSGAISGTLIQPGATFNPSTEVFVYDLVNNTGRRTRIASDGTYELRNLSDGDYRVSTGQRGTNLTFYSPGVRSADDAATVSIRDGIPARDVDIEMPATGFISGKVLAADRTPLPGLLVQTVRIPGADPFGGRTESDGSYRIEAPLGTYDLQVELLEAPSFTFATRCHADGACARARRRRCRAGKRCHDGFGDRQRPPARRRAGAGSQRRHQRGCAGPRTDFDGRFEFRYLPAGDWVINVTLPTGRSVDLRTVTVDEDVVDAGPIDVPNGSIAGTVRHNDAPADGSLGAYTVTLYDGDNATHNVTTDANGHYGFSYLDDGDYRIEARHQASGVVTRYPNAAPPATGTLVTVADERAVTGIDVVLPDTGVITGTATEKSGPAVTDVTVVATSTTGYSNWTRVADDGSYLIELPAGTYTVTFSSSRAGTRYWNTSTPSEATTLTIVDSTTRIEDIDVVYPSGGFVGVVQDLGLGVVGRTIRATAIGGGTSRTTLTTDGGAFAFGYLEAGDYRLSIDMPEANDVELGVLTTGDDGPVVDLILALPIGGIRGSVIREGAALTATAGPVAVSLNDADGTTVRTTALAGDGTFRFSYLSDGDYTVAAQDPIAGEVVFHPAARVLPDATVLPVRNGIRGDRGRHHLRRHRRHQRNHPHLRRASSCRHRGDSDGTQRVENSHHDRRRQRHLRTRTRHPGRTPSRSEHPTDPRGIGRPSLSADASVIEIDDATSLVADIDATFSTGRIAGTLTDAGEPAVNRRLTLRSTTAEDVIVTTDANGDFDARDLSAGTYLVRGSAPGLTGDVLLESMSIGVDDQRTGLDVRYPTGAVTGTITRNGLALSGASAPTVTLTPTDGGDTRSANVTNGEFAARYLAAGDYIASVTDPIGGATRYHPGVASESDATVVTVGVGAVDNVDIALADTAFHGGTIPRRRGRRAQRNGAGATADCGRPRVHDDRRAAGGYMMELAVGTYRLAVTAPTGGFNAYVSSNPSGTTEAANARTFTVIDRTSGADDGDLQLPTGGFAGTITVGDTTGSQLSMRAIDAATGASFATRSGDDGTFVFEYLPAGTYDIAVTVPDQTGEVRVLRATTDGVTVATGLAIDVPVGTISGRVLRNGASIDGTLLGVLHHHRLGRRHLATARQRQARRVVLGQLPARRQLPRQRLRHRCRIDGLPSGCAGCQLRDARCGHRRGQPARHGRDAGQLGFHHRHGDRCQRSAGRWCAGCGHQRQCSGLPDGDHRRRRVVHDRSHPGPLATPVHDPRRVRHLPGWHDPRRRTRRRADSGRRDGR